MSKLCDKLQHRRLRRVLDYKQRDIPNTEVQYTRHQHCHCTTSAQQRQNTRKLPRTRLTRDLRVAIILIQTPHRHSRQASQSNLRRHNMTSSKMTPDHQQGTQDRATTNEKRQLDKELIRARLTAMQNKHADAQARHAANMAAIGNNEMFGQKNSEANKPEARGFEAKKVEAKDSGANSFDNISIGRESRANYLEKLAKAKVKAEKGFEGEGKVEGVKQGAKKGVQVAPASTNLTPTTSRGEDHWGFPIPDSDSEDDEEEDDDSDDFDDEIRYGQATGSGWL